MTRFNGSSVTPFPCPIMYNVTSLAWSRASASSSDAPLPKSSPSVKTMSALRPAPAPNMSTPRTSTSYSAVPPHETSPSTALIRSAGTVAPRASVNDVSLNASRVTLFVVGTAVRNSLAACLSAGMDKPMLPLISSATIKSSATASASKCEIVEGGRLRIRGTTTSAIPSRSGRGCR